MNIQNFNISKNDKEVKNYFDFLFSQKEADYQSQSDYIDSLIEENSGSGED